MRPASNPSRSGTDFARALRGLLTRPVVRVAFALLLLAPFLAQVVGSRGRDACASAELSNGWCQRQGVGYVAGVRIPSADLFDFLDPFGHAYEADAVTCPVCREAIRTDGYCEHDHMGYAHGRAYVSRLGYLLALAEPVEPGTLGCPVCESHVRDAGWCDRCGRGIVAGFAFRDRARFNEVMGDVARLRAAVDRSRTCELCGIALYSGGRCPRCRIFFRDGHEVPPLVSSLRN